MTAKQLIVKLQAVPRDTLILVSSDEEGNAIKPLADVSFDLVADGGFGKFETVDHPSDIGATRAAILWPAR